MLKHVGHHRVEGITPRCQARIEVPSSGFCGRPAVRFRPAHVLAPAGFYCAEHAGPLDEPMPDAPVVRAVTLAISVTLAGVSSLHATAQNEAVCTIEASLEALGAIVDVQRVSCQMVITGAPRRAVGPNASGGEG